MAACTQTSPGPSNPEGADPGAASSSSVVDPQVLSDVVDSAFYLPGPSMRRAMRLERAKVSIEARDCGLEPYKDLDYTGDRYDQAKFPDGELIAQKGLSEADTNAGGSKPDFSSIDPNRTLSPEQQEKGHVLVGDIPCRYKSLPSWRKVDDLTFSWDETAREILGSPQMLEVKSDTAKCLRDKSKLNSSDDNPTATWMNSMDNYLSGLGTDAQWQREQMRLSKVFVGCADNFETQFKEQLAPKRNEAIERNRELLQRFAKELSAAGYVP